jgi:hypothetical protein
MFSRIGGIFKGSNPNLPLAYQIILFSNHSLVYLNVLTILGGKQSKGAYKNSSKIASILKSSK